MSRYIPTPLRGFVDVPLVTICGHLLQVTLVGTNVTKVTIYECGLVLEWLCSVVADATCFAGSPIA